MRTLAWRGVATGTAMLTAAAVVAFGGQRTFADTPAASARPGSTAATSAGCQLGNGVQHVINIVFDNVHFCAGQPERAVRPRADAAPARTS